MGRVTKMYVLIDCKLSRKLREVGGKLPDEIGSVTELNWMQMTLSDSLTGNIPASICELVRESETWRKIGLKGTSRNA
jgi:hypothetical protein